MSAQPKYRLQTLLELRERKKEEAERHLGACISALEAEKQRLVVLERELERMIARRETKKREYAEKAMRGDLVARAAMDANAYLERLKEHEEAQRDTIASQVGVIEQKKEVVAESRQLLVVAHQELKALEKHREKWQEEARKEREAKEEAALDEVAQTLFFAQNRKS